MSTTKKNSQQDKNKTDSEEITLPGTDRHLVLGVSGASGIPYAQCLLRKLLDNTGYTLHLIFSPAAGDVMKREAGMALDRGVVDVPAFANWRDDLAPLSDTAQARVEQYPPRDIGARPASGSFRTDGMIICPASMKTLGALSVGMTDHLLTRAADVVLKENRRLVIVPRETPLSLIHLRAMTTLAEAGAIILPAMPGFYTQPKTLEDIIEFLVMKILDQFLLPSPGTPRWNPK
jgi:4-hydroxy-3-polyprenylbenzoate decarboxylase